MGCVPWNFPGGHPVNAESAQQMASEWSFAVPAQPGLTAVEMIDAGEKGSLDILYSVGGNFLETLPEPDRVRRSLETIPFRVHQDIVLSSQMLVDPAETVVILPAATRYEQPGGGTETSTERRVYYSPEIPGRRIGEAMPEWQILLKVAEAAYPNDAPQLALETAQDIRNEISRVIPAYHGIEELRVQGDAFQWGGPRLCENGKYETPDGKGKFTVVTPPEMGLDEDHFILSTRRGKQFNSMVHREKDPLTGAQRGAVFISKADADRLNIQQGSKVLLQSSGGTFVGYCHIAQIKERNVQVYWPESNALIESGRTDPQCGIPDYNAVVTLEPIT
jgi:predicted molibdopterin-dependent oxidoreductase YjgC